jgi:acetolactate synthase-1/2/3 large subunit
MKQAAKAHTKHPLAGTSMTGADMILQVLADEGVDTLFGYSGGAILPTYDAVFRYNQQHPKKQVRLIVPANEQGACFMAAGYARASGAVGACLVTSGPGATNCVTPIRDCMADSIPVVLITGQVSRQAIGTDAFQEAPVFSVMSPCAKHVFLVSDETELEATIRTAFAIARSGRPGPVVIDIPKDVQNYVGTFQGEGQLHFRGYEKRQAALLASRVSKENAAAFFAMLNESKRPLIYAGGGVINSNAAGELRAFAERFNIPVVTTLMGIGALDTSSDLCLNMLGMHGAAYANYAVEDCDFLITVGARFDDRVAGKPSAFAPNARNIAHIDIDAAEIGKVKSVTWSHTGDAKVALTDLLQAGKGFKKEFSAWVKHVQKLKKDHAMNYKRTGDLIQPHEVIYTLSKITKGKAIITTGVGQHQMWAAQYSEFVEPRTWITSGSMGTMGFGLPAAVGAQCAKPGAIVIDIDGDGSLRMNLGELETMTTNDIPVKVLLLNNLGDGMVRQWQNLYFNDRFSGSDKSMHKKDFVKAAEADGFTYAQRLTDKSKVDSTLREFVAHKGPAFLEVMIDPNAHVYPMVGPGLGYKDMITGEFITPRAEIDAPGHDKTDVPPSAMF